jgi:organic hydroperoxide reductase OsmC/OhrA
MEDRRSPADDRSESVVASAEGLDLLRLPTELGGQGDGANPEQLFAVGFAACFEGALGAVARRQKAELGEGLDRQPRQLAPDRRAWLQARRLVSNGRW